MPESKLAAAGADQSAATFAAVIPGVALGEAVGVVEFGVIDGVAPGVWAAASNMSSATRARN